MGLDHAFNAKQKNLAIYSLGDPFLHPEANSNADISRGSTEQGI